jgi:hypothetical protein
MIALTDGQIEQYHPPENKLKKDESAKSEEDLEEDESEEEIKFRDTRAKEYYDRYGDRSWEVDALRPEVLKGIVEHEILSIVDMNKYNSALNAEKLERDHLFRIANIVKGD